LINSKKSFNFICGFYFSVVSIRQMHQTAGIDEDSGVSHP
jgi:hypothetical protein